MNERKVKAFVVKAAVKADINAIVKNAATLNKQASNLKNKDAATQARALPSIIKGYRRLYMMIQNLKSNNREGNDLIRRMIPITLKDVQRQINFAYSEAKRGDAAEASKSLDVAAYYGSVFLGYLKKFMNERHDYYGR